MNSAPSSRSPASRRRSSAAAPGTLQRLLLETNPPLFLDDAFEARGAASGAKVLLETRIDALDITVLEGGGPDVAQWAQDHGFRLSPDAPEVLDFYAARSPIFLAAVFDGDAAAGRGQQVGDGTPVHLTIPTGNPWVPLRILGLGKQPTDQVEADVYLLTDQQPALLPGPQLGLRLAHSEAATSLLLDDLRSDAGMDWVPHSAWLTRIEVNTTAGDLTYDLAVDATGKGIPSATAARLPSIATNESTDGATSARVLGPMIAVLVVLLPAAVAAWFSSKQQRRA